MNSTQKSSQSSDKYKNFCQNLTKILETQEYVDYQFKFASEEDGQVKILGVHSFILSCISEVFHAMLNGPMREQSPLLVKEVSHDIFLKMLKASYGGDIEFESMEDAFEVYRAAHMYDCQRPIEYAREYLLQKVESKCDIETIYPFAHFYNDEKITKKCLGFLSLEIKQFLCSRKYQIQNSLLVRENDENLANIQKILTKTMEFICNTASLKLRIIQNLGLLYSLSNVVYNVAIHILKEFNFNIKVIPSSYDSQYINYGRTKATAPRKILPQLVYARTKRAKTMFYFKLKDNLNPNKHVWLYVHQNAIKPKCAKLAKFFETSENLEAEIPDVNLPIFVKLIHQMYGVITSFSDFTEAINYFCAALKYEYHEAIVLSQTYINTNLNDSNIQSTYDYAVRNNCNILASICVKKFMGTAFANIKKMFDTHNRHTFRYKYEVPKSLDKILTETLDSIKQEEDIQKKINQALALYKIAIDGIFASGEKGFTTNYSSLKFQIFTNQNYASVSNPNCQCPACTIKNAANTQNEYEHLADYWPMPQNDEDAMDCDEQ